MELNTKLKTLYAHRAKVARKIKRYVAAKNKEIENIDRRIKYIEETYK